MEITDLFSAGGGGPAELGMHPCQSDLPQEVACARGGKHAGEEATAYLMWLKPS